MKSMKKLLISILFTLVSVGAPAQSLPNPSYGSTTITGSSSTAPAVTASGQKQWMSGGNPVYSLIDSLRSTNNHEAFVSWGSSTLAFGFSNDAYSAWANALTISGGFASGISGITSNSGSGSWVHTGPFSASSLSLGAPLPVASGGTSAATASGTSLDNITGFAGTGFLNRTGAGAYSFIANPIPIANGGTGATTQAAALTAILGSSTIPIANGGTNASTATAATSNLQYLQGGTGSAARSVTGKLQERVSVLDYAGVDPTGATDSTAGIQAAITAVCNAGGGTLYFPAGTYKLGNTSLTATCTGFYIAGAGITATTISTGATTSNVFAFSAPLHQGIRDLLINYTGAPTAGAAVSVVGVQNFVMDRVKIVGAFQGIYISGGVIQYYTNLEIRNTVATNGVGIYITGNGNDQFIRTVVMDNPPASQPLAGIRINNTGAVWIDAVDIIHAGTGLLLDPQTASDIISWLFVSNSAFDTSSASGIKFIPAVAGATIKGSTFVNNWTATMTNNGVYIGGAGTTDGVRFIGHRAVNNGQSGYVIASNSAATNVEFNDCDAAGNSTSSSGTYSGFDIGAGVSGFSITNSRAGQQAVFGNTQSRGIIVNPGASNNYLISGNDVRGNVNNTILDLGTGTSKIVKGNLGYNPIASTTITVGASPFTYTNNTGDTVNVFVTGGTVSSVTLGGNTVATSTNTVVPTPQGASVVVTYTIAPTMTYIGN